MAMEKGVSITSVPVETVIGAQTSFKGSINTDKPLTIDGSFEGEIVSTSSVTISENGVIKATIECAAFKLFGKGEGKLTCTGPSEFGSKGEFYGDVTTQEIIVAAGAKLDGNCKIGL